MESNSRASYWRQSAKPLGVVFAIEILSTTVPSDSDFLAGRITVGDFTEEFQITHDGRTIAEFRQEWHRELNAIADGSSEVALRYQPLFIWALYRVGEFIFVRNQLLVDDWGGKYDSEGNVVALPERITMNEDGDQIVELRTHVDAIRRFLGGGAVEPR